MHNNINVNVSGPAQPTSTYKTKVLKGNHSFASQVTEPNMKYVIKHDFVLDGDVTIPENCVLEFDGGSLSNGTVFFNDTKLTGGVKLRDIVFGNLPNNNYIDVTWFGVKGDNITDNSTTINFVIDLVNTLNAHCTLYFPKGYYKYSTIHNLKCDKLNIIGSAPEEVFLVCTGNGCHYVEKTGTVENPTVREGNAAFSLNAMPDTEDPHQPYLITNIKNIVVIGNNNIDRTIFAQGIAYSEWENVYAFNANTTNGTNFYFAGVQISSFKMCGCHWNVLKDTGIEYMRTYRGWYFGNGVRAYKGLGGCTANNFDRCHSKRCKIGWMVDFADQCQWLCGSCEGAENYGFLIGANSKYCTFIGVGCENFYNERDYPYIDDNVVIDIVDQGVNHTYIGCYVSNYIKLQGQGTIIDNLYCTGLQITSGTKNATVKNINARYFDHGPIKGFSDSGQGTISYNIVNYSGKWATPQTTFPIFSEVLQIKNKNIYIGNNFSVINGKLTTPAIKCEYKDTNDPVDTVSATPGSGFIGFTNSTGVGIGVDREDIATASGIGSFRLYSLLTDTSKLHFKRLIAINTWGEDHVLATQDETMQRGITSVREALTNKKPAQLFYDSTLRKTVQWNESEWVNVDGNSLKKSGTFAQKPTTFVEVGFAYFCTDRQTVEGATDGIMIYHKGNNVWVDALGRVVS